jgi:dolichyl-phosphate-mannose-protein mannosyltransferase
MKQLSLPTRPSEQEAEAEKTPPLHWVEDDSSIVAQRVITESIESLQRAEADSPKAAPRTRAHASTSAQEWWLLGGVLVLALIVRVGFMANPGFFNDVNVFVRWGHVFDQNPSMVYSLLRGANYPPLAIYICWFGVKAMTLVNPMLHQPVIYSVYLTPDLPILEKIPILLGDLAFIVAIYRIARRRTSIEWSLGLAAAFAFSPAVIYIGVLWGQLDTIFALFLVLAFWFAIQRQPVWVGITFALALLVKPQPLILTPVLAVYLWRDGWRMVRTAGIALAATGAIACLPYLMPPSFQVFTLLHNISSSVTHYTSSYAYNLWWAVGRGRTFAAAPVIGPLSAGAIGWVCFFGMLGIVCYAIWKAPKPLTLIIGGAVVMYTFFLVTTGQHERYLFPVLPLLLLASLWQRHYLAWYAGISLLTFLNMLSSVAIYYKSAPFLIGQPWMTGGIAVANILCFGVLFILFLKHVWPDLGLRAQPGAVPSDMTEAQA